MAKLNNTIVQGSLRVTEEINANEIKKNGASVLTSADISQANLVSNLGLGTASSGSWGTITSGNGYTIRLSMDQAGGGGIVIGEIGGQTSIQVDGSIYVNEGQNKLATESWVGNNYIPLSGSTSITGSLTPNSTNSINLGAANKYYKTAYIKEVIVPVETGKFEIQGSGSAKATISLDSQGGDVLFTLSDSQGQAYGTVTLPNPGQNDTIATQSWSNYWFAGKSVATQSANGLMSATDKSNLDGIVASLNNDDSDSVVNRLKDVLSVFQDYPEGTTVLSALNSKVNISNSFLHGGADLNTILTTGFYAIGASYTNGPANNVLAYSQLLVGHSGNDTHFQMGFPFNSSRIFFRNGNNNGTWQAWREVITDGNIGSQSVNYANSAGAVEWANVANKPIFATVATSGSYSDLSGKPTNVSSFTNDAGYIAGINSTMVINALGYTPGTSNFTGYTSSDKLSVSYISGLGDSATKDVGTGAGTVAAGNHDHGAIVSNGRILNTSATTTFSGIVVVDGNNYIKKITNDNFDGFRQAIGASNFTGYTSTNKLSTNYIQNDAGYITSSGSCAYATSAGSATDSTKIPLSGTSSLTGSIIPSTNSTSSSTGVSLGSSSKYFNTVYTRSLLASVGVSTPGEIEIFNSDSRVNLTCEYGDLKIFCYDGNNNSTTYYLGTSEGGSKDIATRQWVNNNKTIYKHRVGFNFGNEYWIFIYYSTSNAAATLATLKTQIVDGLCLGNYYGNILITGIWEGDYLYARKFYPALQSYYDAIESLDIVSDTVTEV